MIRRLAIHFIAAWLGLVTVPLLMAETFELINGYVLKGDPIAFNGQGVVIKLEDNRLADRVHWTNFTQNALKKLAKNEEAKPFVEPLIEEDVELEPIPTTKKIVLKPVTRLDRPSDRAGLGSLLASPLSLAALLFIYAANLYAAYEVARYRNYHPAMVCGIAVIAPIIGPIIFMCLPTYFEEIIEEEVEEEAPPEPLLVQSRGPMVRDAADDAPPAPAPVPGGPPAPTIYKRPQTTFNRRFFETKLAAYLKVVPSETERDMVICVTSARGNYIATRIARIQTNELTLLVKKGDASTEVDIPFSEITEVQLRHKDSAV